MNNEASSQQKANTNEKIDTSTADRGIIPAEVAARIDREGNKFKTTADKQASSESVDVTGGATVDQEGLANNYPIEPEIYVDEPGDLKQEEEELTAERANELEGVNQDSEGKLTAEGDQRSKGSGII